MKRHHVNKQQSSANFRRNVQRTKQINITAGPMRGGIRL